MFTLVPRMPKPHELRQNRCTWPGSSKHPVLPTESGFWAILFGFRQMIFMPLLFQTISHPLVTLTPNGLLISTPSSELGSRALDRRFPCRNLLHRVDGTSRHPQIELGGKYLAAAAFR